MAVIGLYIQWLNHPEVQSFQYNTFHRGRNMFLGTFPLSKFKHADHIMIREQTPNTRVKFTLSGEAVSQLGHLLRKCHPSQPLAYQR